MKKNSDEDRFMKEKEQTDSKVQKERVCFEILMFLLTVGAAAAGGYIYRKTNIQIVGIALLAAIGMGSVLFSMEQARQAQTWLFDNGEHVVRFAVLYLFFLLASMFFPLLPSGGWPYLALFVGLMLFSNQVIGFSAATVLLMLTVLLSENTVGMEFFVYFICGLAGITVFSYVNENFRIWLPILVSLLAELVGLSILEILQVNESFRIDMFAVPVLNLLVNLILILILLKYFSYTVIYKKHDRYMDINDPECDLLVELKTSSKEEYYHAVHTAYLCDRIAKKLNLDDAVVKACGYYHRIGVIKGENSWENVESVLGAADFPVEVMQILKEYLDKGEKIISKETVVLLFSDTVISSISYLFSKDPKIQLDYHQIVEAVFKKKTESGIIDQSRMTFGEFREMKKILAEEKLYYDFLR